MRIFSRKSLLLVILLCYFVFKPVMIEVLYAANAGEFAYAELSELLEIAKQENANISIAKERIIQAREDLVSASSEFAPNFVVGGTARTNNEVRYGREREETNAFLNLSQTLYAGGSLTANRYAARMALSGQIAESTRVYQEVLHNVRVAYFDCLRAKAILHVAEEALALSNEHLNQAEKLFRGGIAPKGDVLRVKVSVNQSEIDIITAQSELDVAWTVLENAVGTELDRRAILKLDSYDVIDDLEPPNYVIPANFLDHALSQRAEILAYGFHADRAKALVRAARGQKAPRLSLSGRYNSDEDASSLANGEWYVQLDLQWMLHDGGKTTSSIRKAEAAERELHGQIDLIASQVTQEVQAAEIQLRSSIKKKNLAEEQMRTSIEDYRIALRRYDAQMGTNLDVLDARRSLTNSRREFVNAVYDIARAQAGLIYAIGDDKVIVETLVK